MLLDEAWRVFSNREDYKQGQKRIVVVVKGERKQRWGPPRLGKDQFALCKRFGHWKGECPERQKSREVGRKNQRRRVYKIVYKIVRDDQAGAHFLREAIPSAPGEPQ